MPPSTLALALAAASLLLLPSALADGIYTKSSPVLQVDATSYHSLIAKSNYTSIVEFYAPWCGHCQNLKPAYEKAAKSLTGLAKVAAVNCDEESNKPFCGSMGVQGFPTLKIIKPGKKAGKPIVEDYQGGRTAKAIVDAVIDKIPNHVKRLKDTDYQAWLEESDGAKAILFSDKGTTSALLKAIAVDFLGSIDVAQVRDKEKEAVQVFHVDKFPSLVLLPGDGKEPVTYDGQMKKEGIVAFLSQAALPNLDPAPKDKKAKSSTTKNKSKMSKASSSFSKASESHASSSEAQSVRASQTGETVESALPTESPHPEVDSQKPVKLPDLAPPIPSLSDGLSLQQKCLNSRSGTCILALLPPVADTSSLSASGLRALTALSEIHHKHAQAKRNLFPFYQLPHTNSQAASLRSKLSLGGSSTESCEIIALNGKRGWYRHYAKPSFSQIELEDWIDAIRMGDIAKESVPSGVIVDAEDLPPVPVEYDVPVKGSSAAGQKSSGAEAMREAMQAQMPAGMDLEVEEIDDELYERLMAEGRMAGDQASKKAASTPEVDQTGPEEPMPGGHDEL